MRINQLFIFPNTIISSLEGGKSLALFKDAIDLVDNNTFIGMEVEVEQVTRLSNVFKLPTGGFLWNNTEDGSLRNNGREFVSVPVKGKEVSFALDKLYSLLAKDPHCVNHQFTNRCGLHIHMDAREMEEEEVMSLLYLYIMVEDFFYAFAGHGRKHNIFCVPLKEAEKISFLASMLDSTHPYGEGGGSVLRQVARSWSKYMGLNLLPLSKYGTIEFRQLTGTNNPQEIITWINLILCLKRYVKTHTQAQLMETIDSLNTTSEYLGFLQDVFGEYLQHIPLENPEFKIEQSIVFLKSLQSNFQQSLSVYCTNKTLKSLSECKLEPHNKFFNFLVNSGYCHPFRGTSEKKSQVGTQSTMSKRGIRLPAGAGAINAQIQNDVAFEQLLEQRNMRLEIERERQRARVRGEPIPPPPRAPRVRLANDADGRFRIELDDNF